MTHLAFAIAVCRLPGNTAMHLVVKLAAKQPHILRRLFELDEDHEALHNKDRLKPQHLAAQLHSLPALEILLRLSDDDTDTGESEAVGVNEAAIPSGFGTIHCAAGTFNLLMKHTTGLHMCTQVSACTCVILI